MQLYKVTQHTLRQVRCSSKSAVRNFLDPTLVSQLFSEPFATVSYDIISFWAVKQGQSLRCIIPLPCSSLAVREMCFSFNCLTGSQGSFTALVSTGLITL